MTRGRGAAFAVTNLIKLAGLALALKEGFGSSPHSVTLAIAAFMMAGAQVSEGALLALLDKFFAPPPDPPHNGER